MKAHHRPGSSPCEALLDLLPDLAAPVEVEGMSWGSRVFRESARRSRAPGSGSSGAEAPGPGAAGLSWSSGLL